MSRTAGKRRRSGQGENSFVGIVEFARVPARLLCSFKRWLKISPLGFANCGGASRKRRAMKRETIVRRSDFGASALADNIFFVCTCGCDMILMDFKITLIQARDWRFIKAKSF